MTSRSQIVVIFITVSTLLLSTTNGLAYERYNGSPACDDCHPGFIAKGPLHKDVHVGNQNMTNNCLTCHTSSGDNPFLASSGDGIGCVGCHVAEGLRAHHANAGAPPDANGLTCANCHPGDPPPVGENVLPPYYTRGDVNVNDPCTATAAGGEDFDGDGQGLDNDGDLVYDDLDTDCSVPVDETTWGRIKALYNEFPR